EVKALVYVDAFIPDQGETVGELLAAQPGSCLSAPGVFNPVPYPGGPPGDVDLYINQDHVPGCFATGVPASQAGLIAATQPPPPPGGRGPPAPPPSRPAPRPGSPPRPGPCSGPQTRSPRPRSCRSWPSARAPASPTSKPGTYPSSPRRRW